MNISLDFLEWCQLLMDPRRIDAYARALQTAVTPQSTVVDIGTGLGVFALLACRQGAPTVYAIDAKPMIQLAREVAAANQCSGEIQFIQDDSRRVTLPQRADVIVCDVRSLLPEFQVPVMIDARRRLLAPGGTLIPQADRMWAAVVHSPAGHEEVVGIWTHHPHGLDAEVAHRRSAHTWVAQRFTPDELISTPACWTTIDYATIDDDEISGTLDSQITRSQTGHGLCVWFESELAGGVTFTNRPERRPHQLGAAFFPWPEAVNLDANDRVAVSFDGRLQPGGYGWGWQTTIRNPSGAVKARFDQDTTRHTESSEITRVPITEVRPAESPREHLRLDRHVLAAMERGASLGTIADDLCDTFPGTFRTRSAALTYAGTLSQQYG